MMLFRKNRLVYITILTTLLLFSCQKIPDDLIYERLSPYNFEETFLYLDVAISEHNYRIIHRSDIGKAIRDRGDETFPLSTIINFCNITYAHEMMLINPELINEMPCYITIREEKNKVIVATKLMKTNVTDSKQKAFANKINQNLIGIIEATIE